jgi:iron complex transport system permease protein
LLLIILVALIVGASVAVSGIIGFVGLIVPHLLRILYGSDNKFIIPASAIFGAILVLLSDSLARNIVLPTEIPVGIITSLIGGPYFLFLLTKQR